MRGLAIFLATMIAGASAQTNPTPVSDQSTNAPRQLTVPAGTRVLLNLKSPINTKSAHVGDGVYCQTSFPVTQDNVNVIPAGTFVKGEITHVQRAGRVNGRAEILFKFNTMIFPNGYTVELPGTLKSDPGSTNSTVSDDEGTVKADSQKGKGRSHGWQDRCHRRGDWRRCIQKLGRGRHRRSCRRGGRSWFGASHARAGCSH
jgi:hypothetical protein